MALPLARGDRALPYLLLAHAVLAAAVLPGRTISVSGAKADEDHRLDAIVNTRGALLGVIRSVVVAIGAVTSFPKFPETSAPHRRRKRSLVAYDH